MDAVGTARRDEIRPVVEHEERVVCVARGTKRRGRCDERIVVQVLVAELHDVDTSTQGRIQQRARILTVRSRLEDEVEA
jgi:hypothetical protein